MFDTDDVRSAGLYNTVMPYCKITDLGKNKWLNGKMAAKPVVLRFLF